MTYVHNGNPGKLSHLCVKCGCIWETEIEHVSPHHLGGSSQYCATCESVKRQSGDKPKQDHRMTQRWIDSHIQEPDSKCPIIWTDDFEVFHGPRLGMRRLLENKFYWIPVPEKPVPELKPFVWIECSEAMPSDYSIYDQVLVKHEMCMSLDAMSLKDQSCWDSMTAPTHWMLIEEPK